MVASENDALNGGKVGGLGDVLRDLPRELVRLGMEVDVITPSYAFLHKDNPSTLHTRVKFPFGGTQMTGEIWRVKGKEPEDRVRHFVIEHPDLRGEPIYYNDPSATPFLRDGQKYALFCSAVGQLLLMFDRPFLLHLHDWHAATLLFLRELHPDFAGLKGVPTVFTIHNLAIQGTRPMRRDFSSVERWFPELFKQSSWIELWRDPRYKDASYNPMAVGIRWSAKVNTVSPGYAEEILKPSNHKHGYYGGEGLENILVEKKKQGRLFGILNGCEYPRHSTPGRLSHAELCRLMSTEISHANGNAADPSRDELLQHIEKFQALNPSFMLTTVARIVEQKVSLMFARGRGGATAIDGIGKILSDYNGVCVIVGSGTTEYEEKLTAASRKHERLIYVTGYFDNISRALYTNGTLFLMPSLFEPCGISQMIAMREGQPCIVHAIGGLKDTVLNHVNGFSFDGETMEEQVDNFIRVTETAVRLFLDNKPEWESIKRAAASARFTWADSAQRYVEQLYG